MIECEKMFVMKVMRMLMDVWGDGVCCCVSCDFDGCVSC